MTVQPSLLSIRELRVKLAGRTVLENITLSFASRHLVALVGPNGAGKTTLLRALTGLLPSDGEINVCGDRITKLSLGERAKRLAYLPQGHVVHWSLPVHDVVALGRYPHGATDPARLSSQDAAAVQRAMQKTDVIQFADRSVNELSGGERSRVALARVLAVEAPVLLADEPTASLDPRYQIDVMHSLREIADDGALVIVVTHDLSLASRYADSIVVLSQGRVAAHAPPQQALSAKLLADVFRVSAYRAHYQDEAVILPWAGA